MAECPNCESDNVTFYNNDELICRDCGYRFYDESED